MKRLALVAIGSLFIGILAPAPSIAGSSSWNSDSIYGCVGTAIAAFPTKSEPSAPYAVSAGTLPAGLTLDATSGEITGTPTATYSNTFTISSSDGDYPTATFTALIDATCRPTITDITPNHGPTTGGTSISIVGTGFDIGTTVAIDDAGTPIYLNVTSRTDTTRIIATTPAYSALGPVDLLIRNSDGSRRRITGGFTYEEPVTVSMYEVGGSTPITTLTAAHYVHVPANGDGKYAVIALTGFESSTANHINLNFPVASGSPYNELLYNTQNCNITPVVEVLDTAPPGSPNTPGTIYKTLVVRTGVYVGGAPYQCVPVGTYSMRMHVYDTQGKDAYFDFTLVQTPGPATQFLQPLIDGVPSFGTLRVGVPMAENADFPDAGFGLRVDGDPATFAVGTSALIPDLAANFRSEGKGGGSYFLSGTPTASGPYAFTITATVAGATPSTYSHEFTGLVRYVDSHTATFSGNGSTSGSMAAQVTDYKSPLTANSFARTGYTFTGWNTAANGSGTSYANGAYFEFGSNVTLYAQWSANPPASHTITFNGNGATGGSTPPQTASGTTVIATNGFTRTGYTFHGWRTTPFGGTEYDSGDTYSFASDITLYVEWSAIPAATTADNFVATTYKVTFNANGASGSMPTVNLTAGAKLPKLTYTHDGYMFDHWSTKATVDGTLIEDQGEFSLRSDVTLYAHWAPIIHFILYPEQPVKVAIDPKASTAIGTYIQVEPGVVLGVVLEIPKGAIATPGTLTISPKTGALSGEKGVINAKVEIVDSAGVVVPQLLAPIALHFLTTLGDLVVATSEDGFTWSQVPLLFSQELIAGQSAGYYINPDGTVVVLTSHLSEFGLKSLQSAPLFVTTTATSIPATGSAQLAITGGSGQGDVRFTNLAPEVCDISAAGVLTARAVGQCRVSAIKGGDIDFLHQESTALLVTVKAESSENMQLSIAGASAMRKVAINLGKAQAGKSVQLKQKSPGSNTWKVIKVLTLDARGRATFTAAITAKSEVRLYLDATVAAKVLLNK
jgi:uncharacterized repeat protein (TIGR02543 family)